jgi:hypothetical protein
MNLDPSPRAASHAPEGEMETIKQNRGDTLRRHFDHSSLWLKDDTIAAQRIPPGRASGHSPHRRFAFAHRRTSAQRISQRVSGHAPAGRFPADRVQSVKRGEIQAI